MLCLIVIFLGNNIVDIKTLLTCILRKCEGEKKILTIFTCKLHKCDKKKLYIPTNSLTPSANEYD